MDKKLKKILLLSTGDTFGAYEWIYRMAKLLKNSDYEVAMLVKDKHKTDEFVIKVPIESKTKSYYQRFINLTKRKLKIKQVEFSPDPKYVFLQGEDENVSIVNAETILSHTPFTPHIVVAGMTDSFLGTTTLSDISEKTGARIFQAMVDMSLLTGGCHVVWDCKGFETDCKNCPAILNDEYKNFPNTNFKIKLMNIRKSDIQIITGSGWTTEQAKKSALYRNQKNIYNINSCIDTQIFNTKHRGYAKKIFNINETAKLIFIGTGNLKNKQKGLDYFVEALKILWDKADQKFKDKIYLLIAGNNNVENELTAQIPFKKKLIDYINDYRLLSLAYQAADVFVCSSLEDGGPMMVSEALACGTPVVGFKMGLLYNLVQNNFNGYVAEMKNSNDLAFGINKIISLNESEFNKYSKNAVDTIEKYSSQNIIISTFNQIISEL